MPWNSDPSWLGDLVTLLEDPAAFGLQGDPAGTFGTDLFTSTKAAPPLLALGAASLTLIETGGTSPTRTQNAIVRPAIVRPGAQVVAKANDYETARKKAKLAYDAFVQVTNIFINSGWYLEIDPMQEPMDMGPDARGQAQCKFNILGKVGKRLW